MHILISNDDGYDSGGLRALARQLAQIAEVTVVAPTLDRSAASNSLTLDRPLRVSRVDDNCYAVDGTPTDCVHLAVTGLLEAREPDMVIAGINAGANLGDDVLYSGTVAAAMEGRFLGFPAIAFSVCATRPRHLEDAARLARRQVERLMREPLPAELILNVNIPDRPLSAINGERATRLGSRHRAEPAIKSEDPQGRPIYWVGSAGAEQDAGAGTDFHAIGEERVSVTPLQVDLTRHQALGEVGRWLEHR